MTDVTDDRCPGCGVFEGEFCHEGCDFTHEADPVMSDEQELEVEVRRHALVCPRDRLASAYEFASMLDGYDPQWWIELMRARNCGEMNGKPRRGSCDGDPEIVRALLPASTNISMAAEGSVIEMLAGADVYVMEVDCDDVESSDIGLGLAVVLGGEES